MNEEDPTAPVRKFTLLDIILGIAGCAFVGVVIYRYETQDYFDSGSLWRLVLAAGLYLSFRNRKNRSTNPATDGDGQPDPVASAAQSKAKALVLWVLWFSLTVSILIYQFVLGHGWLRGDDARSATQNPFYWFSLGVLAVATVVRWVLMPRARNSAVLLVQLIIGMALSESVVFYSIFLFPADMPQTKMTLFLLSFLSALQFMPLYARAAPQPSSP